MVIISTVLIIGLGGLTLQFGEGFTLAGIGLSGVAGLLLNLILPQQRD
jgi:uracil permease